MKNFGSRRRTLLALLGALVGTLLISGTATAVPIQAGEQQTSCVADDSATTIAYLEAHHASVMRFGFGHARAGQGLRCIHDAYAAGYKIYLTVGASPFKALLDPAAIAAYYEKWIPIYQAAAPLWAISVENEPELYGYSPAQYRAAWDAVEPVLKRLAPDAKLVFGEGSPWSEAFIKQAWADGGSPQGVDAIGYHAYEAQYHGLDSVPEFSAWAADQGVAFWCSEQTEWMDAQPDVDHALAQSPNVALWLWYYWPQPAQAPPAWASTAIHQATTTSSAATTTLAIPKSAHAVFREVVRRRSLKTLRVLFVRGKRYRLVEYVYGLYRWNGRRYVLVRLRHSKPFLKPLGNRMRRRNLPTHR